MTIMTMMKMWQWIWNFQKAKSEMKIGFHFPPWLQLEMTQEFFCNKYLKAAIYPWNMIQSAISIIEVIEIFLWDYRQLRWGFTSAKSKNFNSPFMFVFCIFWLNLVSPQISNLILLDISIHIVQVNFDYIFCTHAVWIKMVVSLSLDFNAASV